MSSVQSDHGLLAAKGRTTMGDVGQLGLPVFRGVVREELYKDLEFPRAAQTYRNMTLHSTVSSALTIISDTIRQVEWYVEGGAVEGDDALIETCMGDLDRPWDEYIEEFLSILTYGFSVNEKVWKVRSKGKSKHDDGKIGWKRLPARNQASIKRWVWDDTGSDLLGVIQSVENVKGGAARYGTARTETGIPRGKFLLFRHNPRLDSPEGTSPLKGSYLAFKYLVALEEFEAIGVSRDMSGLPVCRLPPEYMSDNASPDKKTVYEYMKTIIRNLQMNESAGIIMPSFVDPETKQDSFGFELMSVKGGGKSYDTNAVIQRYEQKMLMSFLADLLVMGHNGSGSFGLAEEKGSLLTIRIQSILNQITDVLNEDLIPHTFKMNGLDREVFPKIKYKGFDSDSLDSISKFIQRVVSVGAVEVDKPMSDKLRELVELEQADDDKPITMLPVDTKSESGQGMATAGDGNSTTPNGGDSSASNKDNAE